MLGAVIVLLGVLLLANTTGTFDTSDLLLYVPSLFVVAGVYALVRSRFHDLFGPVLAVVPRDWRVEVDVLPVFGAGEDGRPHRAEEHETVDLVVTGFAGFGGVSVSD